MSFYFCWQQYENIIFCCGRYSFYLFLPAQLLGKEYRLGIIQQYRRGIPGSVWIPAAFTVTVENFKAAAPYDPAPLSVGRTTNILRTVQNFTFLRDDFLYQPK